jgi:YbdK family carboxylate-amine ligase
MFGGRHPWATVIRDFEPRSPQQKDLPPDPARREISDGPDQAFAMASHPTLGVEEEFLLADPTTGEPVAVNKAVAAHAADRGVQLELELTSCQIETTSDVVGGSGELRDQLTRLRRTAADAAEASGAKLLAVAVPPTVPREFPITDNARYREIAEKFGMLAHEQGICGCHVHVAVPSREVAIRASNRLRPWLPLFLALSANSAIYRNTDTGYASFRSVLWARLPNAGPPPHFDSIDEYDAAVEMLHAAGVVLDLLESHAPDPALELLECLVERIRPALEADGDYEMAKDELARVAEVGNGAMRQRQAWAHRHDVADVIAELAAATMSEE